MCVVHRPSTNVSSLPVVSCGLDAAGRSKHHGINILLTFVNSENGSYDGRLYVYGVCLSFLTLLTLSIAVGMIMGFIIGLFLVLASEH